MNHGSEDLLIFPKIFKPIWREFSVDNRIFDISMSHIALNGARIMAVVGKVKSCAMTKHMRMDGKIKV